MDPWGAPLEISFRLDAPFLRITPFLLRGS